MSSFLLRALVLGASLLVAGNVLADDWQADKLRGRVLQLVDGQWQPLVRGDVVSDDRVIRTLASGYVEFTRGGETVNLGPNTQIQIHDEGGVKPFTTVQQYFGVVSVEAEVENVQHFAVQTPFLAAVVKGTKFIVTSGDEGAQVEVDRGHVAVTDYSTHDKTTISVGERASVRKDGRGIVVGGVKKVSTVAKLIKETMKPADKVPTDQSDDLSGDGDNGHLDNPGQGNAYGPSDNPGNGNAHGQGENSGHGNSADAPGQNKSDGTDDLLY